MNFDHLNFNRQKLNFFFIGLFIVSNLIFWDFNVFNKNIKNFYLIFIVCFFLTVQKINYKNLIYLFVILIIISIHSIFNNNDFIKFIKINILLYLSVFLIFLNLDLILKNIKNYIFISYFSIIFFFYVFVPIKFYSVYQSSQNILNDIWTHLNFKFTVYCNGLNINSLNLIFSENSHIGMIFPALHFFYILKSKNNIYIFLFFNLLALFLIIFFSSLTMFVSYIIYFSLYFTFFLFKKIKLKLRSSITITLITIFLLSFLSSFAGCKLKFFDLAYSLFFKDDLKISLTRLIERVEYLPKTNSTIILIKNCNLDNKKLKNKIFRIDSLAVNYKNQCIVTSDNTLNDLKIYFNDPNIEINLINYENLEAYLQSLHEKNKISKSSSTNTYLQKIFEVIKKESENKIYKTKNIKLNENIIKHHPNVSSLTYIKNLKMTLISILDKPLGWGMNNYSSAFFNYSDKVEENIGFHFKNRHMFANYSDGSSNLFKLIVEFGFFSIFIIYLIFRFFSSDIDPILKIFILGLVLTSFVRAAGYFNAGFLLCMVIMIASSFKQFRLVK